VWVYVDTAMKLKCKNVSLLSWTLTLFPTLLWKNGEKFPQNLETVNADFNYIKTSLENCCSFDKNRYSFISTTLSFEIDNINIDHHKSFLNFRCLKLGIMKELNFSATKEDVIKLYFAQWSKKVESILFFVNNPNLNKGYPDCSSR